MTSNVARVTVDYPRCAKWNVVNGALIIACGLLEETERSAGDNIVKYFLNG